MAFKDFFFSKSSDTKVPNKTTLAPPVTPRKNVVVGTPSSVPTSRKSSEPESIQDVLKHLGANYKVINPTTAVRYIPLIRKVVQYSPDLGQALHNIVSLGNTGHKVFFDRGVSEEQQDKMRRHLENKGDSWASGTAKTDGLVNKFFSQLMISGALSAEWVPDTDLKTIESVVLPNVETIRFILDRRRTKYMPYQLVDNLFSKKGDTLVKLNENTYRFYALNGDTEIPYATPPFLATLPPIERQKKMLDNLDFVVDQLGMFGFLEVLIHKPDQQDNESDETYRTRLETYLQQAKANMISGFKDGAIIGYKDDHEFNFNTIGKEFDKVATIFQENELQIASGAKQDAALWGRGYSTSETQITVVFMKLLSELRNMQNIVGSMLEFGYGLELKLAGFDFEFITVKFNPSTIQDDLKIQQAEEIKVRNGIQKFLMGTISAEQFADELGYEMPDQSGPRVPVEMLAGGKNPADQAEKDQKREKGKDASDRKVRDKNKP